MKTVDANDVELVEGERVFHVLRQQHARLVMKGADDLGGES